MRGKGFGLEQYYPTRSQKTRRMGHPIFCGWGEVVGEKWFGGQRLREQGFGYVISSDLPDSVEEEDIFAPACL
jgi:hypothetical protein